MFDKRNAISRKFNYCNFARGTLNDVWQIKRGKKVAGSHGATFPEELVEKILTNFSRAGDVVYDPFMGTGTTAVVAKRMGRRYIGSELLPHYVEITNGRVKNE